MGGSNLLSRRSDVQNGAIATMVAAAGHGLVTFLGFAPADPVPLLAYLLPWLGGVRFATATALALVTLFAVEASRAFFTGRCWIGSGWRYSYGTCGGAA
ncbi:hypothetical protein FHR70_003902 [Microvirga lupini]|uniref:Uncharacterized protein n=1 Tax=Microvirga lupini TaxID=420324 RepID=A0A7W4VP94_9HYPH|nr:hypothetical protein [Microvirga lupini]MBB3020814.1 hypothetical protein [Microvirga lupini]